MRTRSGDVWRKVRHGEPGRHFAKLIAPAAPAVAGRGEPTIPACGSRHPRNCSSRGPHPESRSSSLRRRPFRGNPLEPSRPELGSAPRLRLKELVRHSRNRCVVHQTSPISAGGRPVVVFGGRAHNSLVMLVGKAAANSGLVHATKLSSGLRL